MWRYLASGLACAIGLLPARGQSVLTNGDMEAYTACPDYLDQIDRCEGWSRPTAGTSDFFHACSTDPFLHMPDNQFGYQVARSGEGYVGLYAFYSAGPFTTPPDENREYVMHALDAPLVVGNTYAVELYVSLSDGSKYGVADLGALFSTEPPERADNRAIALTPQVSNAGGPWLTDKEGWTRIHGCFVADAAYAYITVGNFNDGAHTDTRFTGSTIGSDHYAYYYVDDVSVMDVGVLGRPSLGPDITACDEQLIGIEEPFPDRTYRWAHGPEGALTRVDTSGTYILFVEYASCITSDTILVTVEPRLALNLPTDTVTGFCRTGSIELSAGPFAPEVALLWSTGETDPWITAATPGLYTLHAWSLLGCLTTGSVLVLDSCLYPVFVPNTFTPNGDDMNDTWGAIWSDDRVQDFGLRVFDRWGGEVFASTDLARTWDGTWGGQALPEGLYAYALHVRGHDGAEHERRGHVLLIR